MIVTVTGSSMEPALTDGDRVLVRRTQVRAVLLSAGKWDLVIVLGVIFVAVAAAAVVTGVAWTFRSLSGRSCRPAPDDAGAKAAQH